MNRKSRPSELLAPLLLLAVVWAGLAVPAPLHAQASYQLTVKSGPLRQSFTGFGASQVHSWDLWDADLRNQMADMVYRDLKMKVLRLWVTTAYSGSQRSVATMLDEFNTRYVASGCIADLKSRGVTTLLLAPGQGWPNYGSPPPSISAYASDLAELILQIKTTYNVTIDVTGISNEPGPWTGAQVVECVNALRAELNARGLGNVKIVAPESSHAQGGVPQVDAMLEDGTAFDNIYAIASHSYGQLINDDMEIRKFDKQWWITEGAAEGSSNPEYPEDESYASWVLSLFLCNMNHQVNQWTYFIGMAQYADMSVTPGSGTLLVASDLKTRSIIPYLQYFYFKQALNIFDVGAIFRKCSSASEGDMFKVLGQNPAINAAAAYNPDGSWGISIVNTTGIGAPTASFGNLFYPATSYNVTLKVEELATTPSKSFTLYRSRANQHFVNSGTVNLINGATTINIAPRELISLRSGPTAQAIPPVPNGLRANTINAPVSLLWNNTVKATQWKVKRSTVRGGPYTTIATTSVTSYDDYTAIDNTLDGTVYYYVVSALNSAGESANSTEISGNGNLAGHWTFDESSHASALDISGNRMTGVLVNLDPSTSWVTGVTEGALAFNGANGYVLTPPVAAPTSLTVACWAKSNTSTWNAYGCLIAQRPSFVLHPEQGSKDLRFMIYTSPTTTTWVRWTAPATFDITQWHHYAGVFDSMTSRLKLYIDGILVISNKTTATLNPPDDAGVFIGSDDYSGRYFNGQIDDVRIYSDALLPSEVTGLATP